MIFYVFFLLWFLYQIFKKKIDLNLKSSVLSIIFWSKLLRITPIFLSFKKNLVFDDKKFYFLKNWAHHWYILSISNNILLLGFFNSPINNVETDIINNIIDFEYKICSDIKNIICKFEELGISCETDFNLQHCMWIEQEIFAEYLDSIDSCIISSLPLYWGKPQIYENFNEDTLNLLKIYFNYLNKNSLQNNFQNKLNFVLNFNSIINCDFI